VKRVVDKRSEKKQWQCGRLEVQRVKLNVTIGYLIGCNLTGQEKMSPTAGGCPLPLPLAIRDHAAPTPSSRPQKEESER
jgi:hypothetical protein